MNITDIPIDILILISEYICDEAQIINGFAVMNRWFSSNLLRKVRKVTLRTNRGLESNFAYEKRLKLLRMIENPFLQLQIQDESRVLFTSEMKMSSIISEVKKVNLLTIGTSVSSVTCIINRMKELNLITKNLRLFSVENIECLGDDFPYLQSLFIYKSKSHRLTSINFTSLTYQSLRSLKLHFCDSLEDVSSLDGIYDLELKHCTNVKDISCLHNNYRVSILECRSIVSYSNSFSNSQSVNISLGQSREFFLNLESCHSMAVLHLDICFLVRMDPYTYSCSLLFLSLHTMPCIRSLPPNRLQKVSIIRCSDFNSLENMNHIRSIHLEGLNKITTLTGLGPKNQIIILRNMNRLEDISSIKDSIKVEMSYCDKLYRKSNALVSVKELRILHFMNLEFVHSLKALERLETLRVLDLTLRSYGVNDILVIEELWYLMLHVLKRVEKFVFSLDYRLLNIERIRKEFIVTIRNLYGEGNNLIIFVRKNVEVS